jgi:hypothetical protein
VLGEDDRAVEADRKPHGAGEASRIAGQARYRSGDPGRHLDQAAQDGGKALRELRE